jgi:hypothetical protein
MQTFIKKNLGLIGFLIFVILTAVDFVFYYFYSIDLNPLIPMTFLAVSAVWTIDWECKREKPTRRWFIYFVILITVILIGLNVGLLI